jgi:hypothetical protein
MRCVARRWLTSSATWARWSLAQAAGKTVLLVGVIATTNSVTDDFDLAVERTADAHGTGFVDVRAVPCCFCPTTWPTPCIPRRRGATESPLPSRRRWARSPDDAA